MFGLWGSKNVYADEIVEKRKKDGSLIPIYTMMEVLVWIMTFPFFIGIYAFIFTFVVLILRYFVRSHQQNQARRDLKRNYKNAMKILDKRAINVQMEYEH